MLQKWDPFQGPKLGSCLTLGNESSEETHVLTKQNGHQKITTQNTELKHTHINLAVLIRHSLKYKNTVSQKTSYRDTELQIQVLTSKISREERICI